MEEHDESQCASDQPENVWQTKNVCVFRLDLMNDSLYVRLIGLDKLEIMIDCNRINT